MTKLPAEAYAIIEGKHSDPFRYLGLHSEGDHSVVRAFIPEASNVEAIGEHGETAPLQLAEEAAEPEPVHRGPAPATAVVTIAELDEGLEVAPIGADRIRRLVALLLKMGQKLGNETLRLRDLETWLHSDPIQLEKSASARSTSFAFFSSLRTFPSSGSSKPKLAFIGWKCLGSASRR